MEEPSDLATKITALEGKNTLIIEEFSTQNHQWFSYTHLCKKTVTISLHTPIDCRYYREFLKFLLFEETETVITTFFLLKILRNTISRTKNPRCLSILTLQVESTWKNVIDMINEGFRTYCSPSFKHNVDLTIFVLISICNCIYRSKKP